MSNAAHQKHAITLFSKLSNMKTRRLITGSLLIIITTVLSAQDWPQFRGPERDGRVTGFKAPASWPAGLQLIWKVQVGSGNASPVLSDGKLIVHTRQADEELVICLDAASGKELWKTAYAADAVTGPAASHPGPRSTPAISDGKVVTFGVSGIISCLDLKTGKILWQKDNPSLVVPQFFTGMSPLVSDGVCIIHTGTKDKGSLLALDLNTGSQKWKINGDGPSYSSPSLMTTGGQKHLVLITEKNLRGINLSDGSVLWQVPAPVQQRFYNCSSPVINGQVIYYTGQGTGTRAVEIIKEGNAYKTRELWSNTEAGAKWTTPVLKDGFLYGFTDQRRLFCINAADGKTAWIDQNVSSDFATIVDLGPVLAGFPSTGNLMIFKPDPKAYSEIARYKVADVVYAFPLFSGSGVFVKDAESVMLYSIR